VRTATLSTKDERRTTFQRMAFGNFKIKADFGGERITDRKLCDGLYAHPDRDLS